MIRTRRGARVGRFPRLDPGPAGGRHANHQGPPAHGGRVRDLLPADDPRATSHDHRLDPGPLRASRTSFTGFVTSCSTGGTRSRGGLTPTPMRPRSSGHGHPQKHRDQPETVWPATPRTPHCYNITAATAATQSNYSPSPDDFADTLASTQSSVTLDSGGKTWCVASGLANTAERPRPGGCGQRPPYQLAVSQRLPPYVTPPSARRCRVVRRSLGWSALRPSAQGPHVRGP